MPRPSLSPLKVNVLIAAVGAVSLVAAILLTGAPQTPRSIPIPFATSGTNLQGSVIFSETRNNLSIYDVTFNHGELSEHLRPDRVYLVHIPADSTIQNLSLDAALTASGGTHTVDYFGYRYSTATATVEIQHVSDASFSARFPAQFFASARARTTDAAHGGMLANFETAKNVTFRVTNGTDPLVKIDPAGALYVLVINDADGATLTVRQPAPPPASSSSSFSSSSSSVSPEYFCNGAWQSTPCLSSSSSSISSSSTSSQPTALSFCSNGHTDDNEQCDDGNATASDGCSASCAIETDYTCDGSPSICTWHRPLETCSDSDGGQNFAVRGVLTLIDSHGTLRQENDQCMSIVGSQYTNVGSCAGGGNCVMTETYCSQTGASLLPGRSILVRCFGGCTDGVCLLPAVCGNGIQETGETCDDGNTMSTDGCSTACQVEAGYICTGTPSQCALGPVCGNGTVEGTEQCDDGNTNPDDACGNNCLLTCGDHNLGQYEECDDGNTASGDGCSSQCTVEPPLASIAPFMWTRETSIPVGSSTFSEYATTVALGKIWVLGGLENGALSAAVYATADGDSWSQMGLLPDARYSASVTEFNGELWVVGGMNCGLKSSCTFQTIYHSPDGAQWTQGPSLPSGTQMVRAPLYVLNGTLFVLSGNGTIYSLSGPDAAWQAAGAFYYTEPRVTVFNNAVWMLSGRSLYASADGTTNWQLKSTLPSSVQIGQYTTYPGNLVTLGNKLVVIGNANDPAATIVQPNCFKVLLSSSDGVHWSKSLTSPCWEPIRNHTVLSFLGKLWLFGQEFSHGDVFSAEPVLP